MMGKITLDEYRAMLKARLDERANTSSGFFGSWARYIRIERELDAQLETEGIIVETLAHDAE